MRAHGPLEGQYTDLVKNPDGYDCHTATGVACPIGVGVSAEP
jgi:hypothetical protein